MATKAKKVPSSVFDPAYVKACKKGLTPQEFADSFNPPMKLPSCIARIAQFKATAIEQGYPEDKFPTLKGTERKSAANPAARVAGLKALMEEVDGEDDAEDELEDSAS